MKKTGLFLTIMLSLLAILPATAQSHSHDEDRLRSMRVAYITEKLDLSPAEAEKFWPLYNEYQSRNQIMEEKGKGEHIDVAAMTDEELEKHVLGSFERMENTIALKREYHGKFKEVLPQRKAALVFAVEHEFVRELVRFRHGSGKRHGVEERREHMRREGGGN